MKQCPFCKADIEENARFCLYCMTPLEEKQTVPPPKKKARRWLLVAGAVLAVMLVLLLSVWGWRSLPDKPSASPAVGTGTTDRLPAIGPTTPHTSTGGTATASGRPGQSLPNGKSTTTQATVAPAGTDSTGGTGTRSTGIPSPASTAAGATATPSSANPGAEATTASSSVPATGTTTAPSSATPTTGTTTQAKAVVYTYRKARYGDDFSVSTVFEETDIVITGVSSPAADGHYVIPANIDGKRVVAIMGGAFSDADAVKSVIIPSTVKTVWNYAFSACRNLTDVYLCGNAVYIEAQAFAPSSSRTGTLTLHCSASCTDRNLRYYKSSAAYYGAVYKEWDGRL